MAKGFGYGKCILFGEHFVVYGIPAIGVGLGKKAEVEIAEAQRMTIESEEIKNPKIFLRAFGAIKKEMGVRANFSVRVKSEIPLGSGMGASAAISVGFARALANYYKTLFKGEEIAAFAYQGEKIFHGHPSGIDNTLAAFGGTIYFQKRAPELGGNIIRHLKIKRPFWIVIGNAERLSSTKELVANVQNLKKRNEDVFAYLFEAERRIIARAEIALKKGDLEEVGQLMNLNHGLLSAVGVSTLGNEQIVYIAREAGALGAKITGAGGGGACIALAKNESHAKRIAQKLKRAGFTSFYTEVKKYRIRGTD